MKRSDFVFIFISFLIWRIGISVIAVFAIKFIPLFSNNYFGGSFSTYQTNPLFWGHLNFDGEHYLSIAQSGYKTLEYFFFPLFPYLIKVLSTGQNLITIASIGLIISNLSFFIALIGIYKLVKLDYKENVAKLAIILFLIFPTSFYFGAFYTESLFLALVVWTFVLARKNNFLLASLFAALASATRIVGIVLFPILFLEFFIQKRKNFLPILFSPLGVILYIYYLFKQTGDPLIFFHQVSIFGQQRSSKFILLPQVLYRYFFEILPHVSYLYFPNVFTTYLEFICGIVVLFLVIFSFFKLRITYAVYAFLTYLIPTLAGSFSSMPRYALIIFPIFILIALYLDKVPRTYRYIFFSVMILMLIIAESLFWRGYWIS